MSIAWIALALTRDPLHPQAREHWDLAPPPPAQLVDNEYSILDATDLVMIDPVGTGFSKPVGKAIRRGGGCIWSITAMRDFWRRG